MIAWREKIVKVADLKPYERNPRRISPAAFAKLKDSLKENGYHQRILATTDLRVIGGHQRIWALNDLGIKEIAVLMPDAELTDDQFRRLLIQDNLPFGEFDFEMLANDFDVNELLDWGLPDDLLAKFPGQPDLGLTDPDDAPEAPARPVTVLGDIWLIGNHRIICGDSTSAEVVGRLLGEARPHLMVTDPPYGVEYDANWRNEVKRKGGRRIGGCAIGKVLNDDRADWREAWALAPCEVAYVWHDGIKAHIVAESLIACGFNIRAQIIWAKSQLAIGRGHYHHQHEPCLYAVKKNGSGHWAGDRKQATLWQIEKPLKSETGHSTQKPVECMRRPIENNSSPGQAIYEPFSGSGTTIIAAEQTGRHCYAIELNPEYVDVAVKRWQNFTGQRAIHAETGKTYDELANAV